MTRLLTAYAILATIAAVVALRDAQSARRHARIAVKMAATALRQRMMDVDGEPTVELDEVTAWQN